MAFFCVVFHCDVLLFLFFMNVLLLLLLPIKCDVPKVGCWMCLFDWCLQWFYLILWHFALVRSAHIWLFVFSLFSVHTLHIHLALSAIVNMKEFFLFLECKRMLSCVIKACIPKYICKRRTFFCRCCWRCWCCRHPWASRLRFSTLWGGSDGRDEFPIKTENKIRVDRLNTVGSRLAIEIYEIFIHFIDFWSTQQQKWGHSSCFSFGCAFAIVIILDVVVVSTNSRIIY